MRNINEVKTILFSSTNLNDALTKLTEIGITFRECTFSDTAFHVVDYDITFWPTTSLRCPLAVCISGNLFDYDDRQTFYAEQQRGQSLSHDDKATVPAIAPTVVQHLFVSNPSSNWLLRAYPKYSNLRTVLREERRLKNSRVKGLSS